MSTRVSRRVRMLLVAVAVAALITSCASNGGAAGGGETVTLRLAGGSPPTATATVEGEQFFIKEVERLSQGKIKIEHFPAEQLGSAEQMVDLLQKGVADITWTPPGYFPSQMPLSNVVSLPGSFDSGVATHAYQKLLSDTGSAVYQTDFKKNGLHPLFDYVFAGYELGSNVPFSSLREMTGMQVRSTGGTVDMIVRALGAVPTPVTFGDIYTALDNGTVDATLQPPSSQYNVSYQEVIGWISTNGNFTAFPNVWSMTEEKFASLSPDVQSVLERAGKSTTEHLGQVVVNDDAAALDKFQKAGVRLVEFGPEELRAIEQRLSSVSGEWVKKNEGLPATTAIDEWKAAVHSASGAS